jgi:BirA family biotin operon repressor/biotin-[acetyl-CoA-carboxylase] ligase
VVAHLPGGASVTGVATRIDGDGGLVVQESGGTERVVVAGDIEHLRAAIEPGR